jgi:hypothetical protein
MATTVRTTATLAADFDTDPKTLRRFLRSGEGLGSKVGKGKSWNGILSGLNAKDFAALRTRFTKWNATPETDNAPEAPGTDLQPAPKPAPPAPIKN